MRLKTSILFFIVFCSAKLCCAQLTFSINGPYFIGDTIQQLSVNDQEAWMIKGSVSKGLGFIDTNNQTEIDFTDSISSVFQDRLTSLFSDNAGEVFLGTESEYMYSFINFRSFFKFDNRLGILDSRINSIDRSRWGSGQRLSVATDNGLYIYYEDSLKFIKAYSGHGYTYDTTVTGESNRFHSTLYHLYNYDFFQSVNCSDRSETIFYYTTDLSYYSYLNISVYPDLVVNEMTSMKMFSWNNEPGLVIGTTNGVLHHDWKCNNPGSIQYLDNLNIKAVQVFYLYPSELTFGLIRDENGDRLTEKRFNLAGSNNGLYIKSASELWTQDNYVLVVGTEGWEINDIKIDPCSKNIWVGTNAGLYKLSPDINIASVDEPPVFDWALPDTVYLCASDPFLLTGYSEFNDITWLKDGQNTGHYYDTISITEPGVYKAEVSNCLLPISLFSKEVHFILDTVVLFESNLPSKIELCNNETSNLEIVSNDPRNTIKWFKDNQLILEDSTSLAISQPGQYWAEVSNCNGKTHSTNIVEVEFFSLKDITLSQTIIEECGENANAFLELNNLQGEINISWFRNGFELAQFADSDIINIYESGIYSVQMEILGAVSSCQRSIESNLINFYEEPEFHVEGARDFCEGETIEINLSENNLDYSINEQRLEGNTFTIDKSSTLEIKAINENGCSTSVTFSVLELEVPKIELPSISTYCFGYNDPYILEMSSNAYDYILDDKVSTDSRIYIYKAGEYTISVIDRITQCQTQLNLLFEEDCKEIFIPNAITPNDDGLNDTFEILELLPNSRIKIFNRWGNEIYSSYNYAGDWSASNLSSGVYYYEFYCTYRGYYSNGVIHVLR